MTCWLLLGSSMGDRAGHIRRALSRLDQLPSSRVAARSRLYETAPMGGPRRDFLNCAARLETGLSPMGLLVEAKRLEALAGRRPGPRWRDRPLDIDILSHGDRRIASTWLRLPHPELRRRAFALAPLAELAPSWRPYGRQTVAELLGRLNPDPRIVKLVKP